MSLNSNELNELRDTITKSVMAGIQSYIASRENDVSVFSYGMYHYRLFANGSEVTFYQWKTKESFNFSVGGYIESEFEGKSLEGRWLIKSISYNIEPNEDIMVDINVEFEPY